MLRGKTMNKTFCNFCKNEILFNDQKTFRVVECAYPNSQVGKGLGKIKRYNMCI